MKLEIANTAGGSRGSWVRRLGVAGTLFFLVKGLLWVLVPVVLAWFGHGG